MIANNFNLLRLFAAFLVLYGHGYDLQGLIIPSFLSHLLGLHIFFAISGYLIVSSWQHDPHFIRYFWRRSLRIFPALTFAVLLSILVLGPLMTVLDTSDYWRERSVIHYLSNIVLYTGYTLPGVFTDNIVPHAVNGSLWTLPVEFFMYITVALLGMFCMNSRWLCLAVFSMWLALSLGWDSFGFGNYVVYGTFLKPLTSLAVFFWAGVCINRWDIARYFSLNSFVIILIIWIFSFQLPTFAFVLQYFALPFLVVCFGCNASGQLSFFNKADYSYGVYIYAFPIQQILVAQFPSLPLLVSIAICALLTFMLAAFSWHAIEKPMLRFKPKRKKQSVVRMEPMEAQLKEAT
ncbi:MAG: peptidoglycan/LPS O-acetylase OafA/YrhL [Oleiphilaceae bacterium]|jgi:peptidoglycan/LPS O-acetylase OafA/YrhL